MKPSETPARIGWRLRVLTLLVGQREQGRVEWVVRLLVLSALMIACGVRLLLAARRRSLDLIPPVYSVDYVGASRRTDWRIRYATVGGAMEATLLEVLNALAMDVESDAADWRKHAQCAETDPEAFFPEKGEGIAAAKRVCLSCPVRDKCLEAALENDERFGVWGAKSRAERVKIQRARRPRGTAEESAAS